MWCKYARTTTHCTELLTVCDLVDQTGNRQVPPIHEFVVETLAPHETRQNSTILYSTNSLRFVFQKARNVFGYRSQSSDADPHVFVDLVDFLLVRS